MGGEEAKEGWTGSVCWSRSGDPDPGHHEQNGVSVESIANQAGGSGQKS